jgi:8-oxo-dGTP pyrophosphatase MutT (NUDIX family)
MMTSDDQVLLQLRSSQSHHPLTWGLPGGARQAGETPLAAALREGREETGLDPDRLTPDWWVIADHGGWTYTTVGASAEADPLDGDANWETERLEWVPLAQVAGYDLHPGLRAAWTSLELLVGKRATLIVDAANVVGATPNGWWRDRAAAAAGLLADLEPLAARGMANLASPQPAGWFPQVVMVVEGQARGIGPGQRVRVVEALASGDDQIVAEARRATAAGLGPVEVVTADKALIARLGAVGAGAMSPRGLLRLIR